MGTKRYALRLFHIRESGTDTKLREYRSLGWIDSQFVDYGNYPDLCRLDYEVGEGSRDYKVEIGYCETRRGGGLEICLSLVFPSDAEFDGLRQRHSLYPLAYSFSISLFVPSPLVV